jgi:hypothetical protein
MRASIVFCFGSLVFLGCARSPATESWPSAVNPQTVNNLTQFGLAEGAAQERLERRGQRARKLVYNADVDILVDNLATAEQELASLLKAHDGIVAMSATVTRAGQPRTGLRRLRIPVAHFDAFLKALADLGEVQHTKLDVQDVTRSHSELEEQLRNLDSEVTGLRALLAKPAEKLADTLAVREQLGKVTREREALKARLERMQAQADYSTVTLRLLEWSGSATSGGSDLGSAAARAFSGSWQMLIAAGRGTLLFLVRLVPWLPVVAIATVPFWIWRWRRRAALTS